MIFPSSISALFTARLEGSIEPLKRSLELHRALLRTPTDSPDFSPKAIIAAVNQAEGSLAQLAAASRLLGMDVIYSRFAPSDFGELHALTRRLVVRSNGMTVYFTLLDTTREKFPMTPGPSRPQTPALTPVATRPPSPVRDHDGDHTPVSPIEDQPKSATSSTYRRRRHPHLHFGDHSPRSRHHGDSHSHNSHHNLLHHSLLHLGISHHAKPEEAVGVFESNRYINLESMHMTGPDSVRLSAQTTKLLDESADELLGGCVDALKGVCEWMGQLRKGRWDIWVSREKRKKRVDDRIKKYEEMKKVLEDILDRFRNEKRKDN